MYQVSRLRVDINIDFKRFQIFKIIKKKEFL